MYVADVSRFEAVKILLVYSVETWGTFEEERNRWLVYTHFVARIFEVVEAIQSISSN